MDTFCNSDDLDEDERDSLGGLAAALPDLRRYEILEDLLRAGLFRRRELPLLGVFGDIP